METNLYAKLIDGIPTTTCAAEEDTDLIAQILADGFKPYDDSAERPAVGEFQAAIPAYSEDADRIFLRWKIADNSPEMLATEIEKLKSELAATDYQVIKSYEFTLAGVKQPYDTAAIHVSRQALRDRIGELEGLLVE